MDPATENEANSTTTFPFDRLALELREMIWAFTLPKCQVHYAYGGKFTAPGNRIYIRSKHELEDFRYGLWIESPLNLVALMVTKESRRVAFRYLRELEHFIYNGRSFGPDRPSPRGYYNPAWDCLHLTDEIDKMWNNYLDNIPFATISKDLKITQRQLWELFSISPLEKSTQIIPRHYRFLVLREGDQFNEQCQCRQSRRSPYDPLITEPFWDMQVLPQESVEPIMDTAEFDTAIDE